MNEIKFGIIVAHKVTTAPGGAQQQLGARYEENVGTRHILCLN